MINLWTQEIFPDSSFLKKIVATDICYQMTNNEMQFEVIDGT